LSGVQDDTAALARVGWAVRRLTGGPGPDDAFREVGGLKNWTCRVARGRSLIFLG